MKGLFCAIAALSLATVTVLNEHAVKAARNADVSERLRNEGAEVVASTPAQFRKVIVTEVRQWAQVIRQAGIKAE